VRAPDYTIESEFGDSLEGLSFQWLQADGTPKDLTGYTASLIVWDSASAVKFTLALTTGLSAPTPTNGTVIVNATAAQIAAAVAGATYTYRLQVVSGDVKRTLAKGAYIVHPQIPSAS
jgi:hypothetical protein